MINKSNVESLLRYYAQTVDPIIKELLAEGVSQRTSKLLQYQINTGGKRLRPALTILSCLACGGKLKDALYPAAGIEILHTYTLIIDDIIDNSPRRRGHPTTWKKFGRSFAECAALDYGAAVLQAVLRTKRAEEIGRIIARAWKKVVDGEILDIFYEQGGRHEEPYARENRKTQVNLNEYRTMIGEKTASLFRASCEIGGVSAHASLEEIQALLRYGWHFGLLFQIVDDVVDIHGDKTRKTLGQDIKEHKLGNILILLALQELSEGKRSILRNFLRKSSLSEQEVREATGLVEETAAKQRAFALLISQEKAARKALSALPWSGHREMLESILRESIDSFKNILSVRSSS